MNTNCPFAPGIGANFNKTITASASSQSVTMTAGFSSLRIAVSGTAPIWFATGTGSATATTTDYPALLPGTTEIFTIPSTADTVAIISSGAGSTVYLTRGEGM